MRVLSLSLALVASAEATSVGDRLFSNVWNPTNYPLNTVDALANDWTDMNAAMGVEESCGENSGHRYRKTVDGVVLLAPTLMFDNTGYLAGIQVAVDTNNFPLYPGSSLRPDGMAPFLPSFGDPSNILSLSIHFKDPTKMCTATEADHVDGSLGDRFDVRLADGTFDHIPLFETEMVDAITPPVGTLGNGYIRGGCAPSDWAYPGSGSPGMGYHYWRGLAADGVCSDPQCLEGGSIAVMYAKGMLQAFSLIAIGTEGRTAASGDDGTIATRPARRPTSFYQLGVEGQGFFEFPSGRFDGLFFSPLNSPQGLMRANTFDETDPRGMTTVTLLHTFLKDSTGIECPATSAFEICPTGCTNKFDGAPAGSYRRLLFASTPTEPPTVSCPGACIPNDHACWNEGTANDDGKLCSGEDPWKVGDASRGPTAVEDVCVGACTII